MGIVADVSQKLSARLKRESVPSKSDWPSLYGCMADGERSIAELADKHWVYERAVQDSAAEVQFARERYQQLRGRYPQLLREDFCGTATICSEWVKAADDARAIGVDLDPDPLQWGCGNNLQLLTDEQQERALLVQADCAEFVSHDVDVLLALNFSYWLFMDRDRLRRYFSAARESLAEDGMLILDAFGGSEAHQLLTEDRECDGFIYRWEQASLNPVTQEMQCYLHFLFPDGSEMDKAFSYYWRVWSLPELIELLQEAGFSPPKLYWHEPLEDGSVHIDTTPRNTNDADPGWICYLLCEPARSATLEK